MMNDKRPSFEKQLDVWNTLEKANGKVDDDLLEETRVLELAKHFDEWTDDQAPVRFNEYKAAAKDWFDKHPQNVLETVYDEETLTKVYMAMQKEGLDSRQAIALVHALQNEGILFRERA
jgi:hypothetical protein